MNKKHRGNYNGDFFYSAKVILCVLLCCVYMPVTSYAEAKLSVATEYQIKTAFLFNFANLFTWPSGTFEDSPFVLCIFGPDPFGVTLDVTIEGEQIQGQPIKIRRFSNPTYLSGCHLLYISADEMERADEIIRRLAQTPVLTVSDMPGFIKKGGMIAFFNYRHKIRFAIYTEAIADANLYVSAKLLKIAKIVRPD